MRLSFRNIALVAHSSVLAWSGVAKAQQTTVFINEIHYDNMGTDTGEFVEIAGPAGMNLNGWRMVLYNGANQNVYNNNVPLSGSIPDQQNGFGTVHVTFPTNGLQNGSPDGVALVDDSGACVQFLSYEGSFTAVGGPCDSTPSTDIGVFESSSTLIGLSLQLTGGPGSTYEAFSWSINQNTAGEINKDQMFGSGPTTPTPVEALFIHEIQGTIDTSPKEGVKVSITGIVTGDFQDGDADTGSIPERDLNGFFLQEEDTDADDDASTSEGIFVFDGSNPAVDVNVGDLVTVVGTVSEFFGQTQISSESVTVLSSGNELPTPVEISLPSSAAIMIDVGEYLPDLEAYEGMLVEFPQTLQITEQFNLDRFNEIRLVAGERPYQYTQINPPDPVGYIAYLEDLARRTITYDDGLSVQNALIGNLDGFGPAYTTSNAKRMGDTITGLSGILTYGFSAWRVRSTVNGKNTFVSANPRPASPSFLPGAANRPNAFKMASLNVLNFFTTLDGATTPVGVPLKSGPNGLDPRGADLDPNESVCPVPAAEECQEYKRQLEKLVTAIVELDADILGLVELENEFDDQNGDGMFAIGALVDAVNVAMGGEMYQYVDPGVDFIGGDAIAVGFIYKPAKLTLLGSPAILDSTVDDRFIDTKNRPALAASFRLTRFKNGPCFTASVNHFKSKGSDCEDVDDIDEGDGQGNCNGVRTAAADALADWMKKSDPPPTGASCESLAILGDLNSYAMEDPIKTLEAAGFINVEAPDAYSYVFDGQIGTLDYIMVNQKFLSYLYGAEVWHVNADEADALDYNLDFSRDPSIFDGTIPYRNSDHDPLVAAFFPFNRK